MRPYMQNIDNGVLSQPIIIQSPSQDQKVCLCSCIALHSYVLRSLSRYFKLVLIVALCFIFLFIIFLFLEGPAWCLVKVDLQKGIGLSLVEH